MAFGERRKSMSIKSLILASAATIGAFSLAACNTEEDPVEEAGEATEEAAEEVEEAAE